MDIKIKCKRIEIDSTYVSKQIEAELLEIDERDLDNVDIAKEIQVITIIKAHGIESILDGMSYEDIHAYLDKF